MNRIKECKKLDEPVAKAVKELHQEKSTNVYTSQWAVDQELILFEGRIYVPKDPQLRHDILQAHHDSTISGHPGQWKTLELVTRNFWWPGVSNYVARYVKSCDKCNRTKTYPAAPAGPLMPNEIPQRRWQIVTVDLITGLPSSHGFDAIWVTVDRLSKRIHVAPTTGEIDSVGVARLFRDHVWRNHGLPEQIISDRGPQFVSNFTKELNRLLGIQTRASTAFHPQTDGQTERVNQEIEQYLRIFSNHRQDDWSEWIPLAEFAYNNRVHASTRLTPFQMDNGQNPRMGIEPQRHSQVEATQLFVDRMKKISEETQSALRQAASDMSRHYNVKHSRPLTFKVGDKVWLDSRNIKTVRPMKKLDDRWFGPFKIKDIISQNAYRLELSPALAKIHPVFHVSLLRPFTPDEIQERPQNHHPAPILDADGELSYEVEAILDSRYHNRRLEYLVNWKGYGPEENTWQSAKDVEHAPRLVAQFHNMYPNAVGPQTVPSRPQ